MRVTNPYERIDSALDRLAEAHFWIHKMEDHYHEADYFRWHLNAFLKALREVPEMIKRSMKGVVGFDDWYRQQIRELKTDVLIRALQQKRNFVVHEAMLLPRSRCTVGITTGSVVKMGMSFEVNPLEDSDSALLRIARRTKDVDFLGLNTPDEDTLPFVERQWRLEEFEEELVDLCAAGWLRIGQAVADALRWQGVEPPSLSLDCRHGDRDVRRRLYDRDWLTAEVGRLEEQP